MKLVQWSGDALEDFDRIIGFIAADNRRAADLVADRVASAVARLAEMPLGRRGRVKNTYEKLVTGTRLIVAYALVDDPAEADGRLVVLRIVHSARDWPEGQWPE